MCAVCMCACVKTWEKERDRERERQRGSMCWGGDRVKDIQWKKKPSPLSGTSDPLPSWPRRVIGPVKVLFRSSNCPIWAPWVHAAVYGPGKRGWCQCGKEEKGLWQTLPGLQKIVALGTQRGDCSSQLTGSYYCSSDCISPLGDIVTRLGLQMPSYPGVHDTTT